MSPSAESGAAATTVYRCPDTQEVVAPKQPRIVPTDKTTTVERGSAEIPWFEPKRVESQIESMAAAAPPTQVDQQAEDKKIEKKPLIKAKAKAKVKPVRKKLAKPKPAQTKAVTVTAAKAKPDTKKSDGKNTTAKNDDNTIVWTQKDLPIGSRIANWLGL